MNMCMHKQTWLTPQQLSPSVETEPQDKLSGHKMVFIYVSTILIIIIYNFILMKIVLSLQNEGKSLFYRKHDSHMLRLLWNNPEH